ncbi:tonB-system energizer ExbB [Paracoccus caeni]|uniref:Biopolymer transport protein ExbB n=1 Tax=Paracoccus caeni TaxID=657651 RepID=A0A934W2S0_9RHOB|nr:tonB-system energizer ExbB [Paracoccus caeni]MBK4218054.1 tonB-system energizer ExbB [Paracoccus caeni]
MTNTPLPRLSAGIVATLACLLAGPSLAQDTTPAAPQAETQAPATPETETAPAASTPETPATETAAPAVESPAVEPTAPESTAPAAETPAAETPAAETPAADAPAAPATEAPATEAPAPAAETPATDAPVEAPVATAESPATAPAAVDTPATDAATDTPAAEAPATPAPAAVEEPVAEPAEESGFLPQSIQNALSPILETHERDPNLPHDLSPMGMFQAADWVVKSVMIGLAFASVVTWTVFFVKVLELWRASANVQSGTRRIERAANLPAALSAIGNRRDPVSRMVRAAAHEYGRSAPALDQAGDHGVKERVDSHLERIEARAGRTMSRGTGVLATIGSTAPFVGLFGTVWGIMNSFIGISEAQTTNLAVVAPGIAEALLATAIGLVAAIPAVVIYNVFARAITGYRLRLANAAAGVRRMVSRDLDFRGIAPAAAAPTANPVSEG